MSKADYSLLSGPVLPASAAQLKEDPRTGLPIVSVPQQFITSPAWQNLRDGLIHFISDVSFVNAKKKEEARVLYVTDTTVYLASKDGKVSRCIPVTNIDELTEQSDTRGKWINFKVPRDGFDLRIMLPGQSQADQLGNVMKGISKNAGKEVTVQKNDSFNSQSLNLTPPAGFDVQVRPIPSKQALYNALKQREDSQKEIANKFEERLKQLTHGIRDELEAEKTTQVQNMFNELQDARTALSLANEELERARNGLSGTNEALMRAQTDRDRAFDMSQANCRNCSATMVEKERAVEMLEQNVSKLEGEIRAKEILMNEAIRRNVEGDADKRALESLRIESFSLNKQVHQGREALNKSLVMQRAEADALRRQLKTSQLALDQTRLELRKEQLRNVPTEPEISLRGRLLEQEADLNDLKLRLVQAKSEADLRNIRGHELDEQEAEILRLTAALEFKEFEVKETRAAVRDLLKNQLRDLKSIKKHFDEYDNEILNYLDKVFNPSLPLAIEKDDIAFMNEPLYDVLGMNQPPPRRQQTGSGQRLNSKGPQPAIIYPQRSRGGYNAAAGVEAAPYQAPAIQQRHTSPHGGYPYSLNTPNSSYGNSNGSINRALSPNINGFQRPHQYLPQELAARSTTNMRATSPRAAPSRSEKIVEKYLQMDRPSVHWAPPDSIKGNVYGKDNRLNRALSPTGAGGWNRSGPLTPTYVQNTIGKMIKSYRDI